MTGDLGHISWVGHLSNEGESYIALQDDSGTFTVNRIVYEGQRVKKKRPLSCTV